MAQPIPKKLRAANKLIEKQILYDEAIRPEFEYVKKESKNTIHFYGWVMNPITNEEDPIINGLYKFDKKKRVYAYQLTQRIDTWRNLNFLFGVNPKKKGFEKHIKLFNASTYMPAYPTLISDAIIRSDCSELVGFLDQNPYAFPMKGALFSTAVSGDIFSSSCQSSILF